MFLSKQMKQESKKFNSFMKDWLILSIFLGLWGLALVSRNIRQDFMILLNVYLLITFSAMALSQIFWSVFAKKGEVDVKKVLETAWMPNIPVIDDWKIELSYTKEAFEDLEATFDENNPNVTYISFPKKYSLNSVIYSTIFFHELGHLKQIMEKGKQAEFLKKCLSPYKNPMYEQLFWIVVLYGIHLAMYQFNVFFSPAFLIPLVVIYIWRFSTFLSTDIVCELNAYSQTIKELVEHCNANESKEIMTTFSYIIITGVFSYLSFYLLGLLLATTLV